MSPDAEAIARRERIYPHYTGQAWAYLVRAVCRQWPECRAWAGALAEKPTGHQDRGPR